MREGGARVERGQGRGALGGAEARAPRIQHVSQEIPAKDEGEGVCNNGARYQAHAVAPRHQQAGLAAATPESRMFPRNLLRKMKGSGHAGQVWRTLEELDRFSWIYPGSPSPGGSRRLLRETIQSIGQTRGLVGAEA